MSDRCTYLTRESRASRLRSAPAPARPARSRDANDITLENAARISASTVDGTGGAVTLHAATVRLDGGSEVSAATTGLGNGGDVAISANTIDLTRQRDLREQLGRR